MLPLLITQSAMHSTMMSLERVQRTSVGWSADCRWEAPTKLRGSDECKTGDCGTSHSSHKAGISQAGILEHIAMSVFRSATQRSPTLQSAQICELSVEGRTSSSFPRASYVKHRLPPQTWTQAGRTKAKCRKPSAELACELYEISQILSELKDQHIEHFARPLNNRCLEKQQHSGCNLRQFVILNMFTRMAEVIVTLADTGSMRTLIPETLAGLQGWKKPSERALETQASNFNSVESLNGKPVRFLGIHQVIGYFEGTERLIPSEAQVVEDEVLDGVADILFSYDIVMEVGSVLLSPPANRGTHRVSAVAAIRELATRASTESETKPVALSRL